MSVMFDANFFIAVIVATIVSFVVGGIWYGPAFGKAWMAALGKTEADMDAMRKRGAQRVRSRVGRGVHRVVRARAPDPVRERR